MFKQFLKVSPEGILMINQQYDRIFANDAIYKIFPISSEFDMIKEILSCKNAYRSQQVQTLNDFQTNTIASQYIQTQSKLNLAASPIKRVTIQMENEGTGSRPNNKHSSIFKYTGENVSLHQPDKKTDAFPQRKDLQENQIISYVDICSPKANYNTYRSLQEQLEDIFAQIQTLHTMDYEIFDVKIQMLLKKESNPSARQLDSKVNNNNSSNNNIDHNNVINNNNSNNNNVNNNNANNNVNNNNNININNNALPQQGSSADAPPLMYEITIIPCVYEHLPAAFISFRDVTQVNEIKILRELNENKTAMLRNVSHDFRTPLNSIIQNLEMLQALICTDLCQEYVEPALCSSKILMNLLNDILDLAQIKAGKFKIVNQQFEVRELFKEIVKIQKVLANTKGLELTYAVEEAVPQFFNSDPNRIKQIIINLVGNAIKYLSPLLSSLSLWLRARLQSLPRSSAATWLGPNCPRRALICGSIVRQDAGGPCELLLSAEAWGDDLLTGVCCCTRAVLVGAFRFTQKGSVLISCTVEEKQNDIYQISVADTGIGISDNDLKKLFKAFGKLDLGEKQQSMNTQGVGLGLLISNDLAKNLISPKRKNYGIQVKTVQSAPGDDPQKGQSGSVFSFSIYDHPFERIKVSQNITTSSYKDIPTEFEISQHRMLHLRNSQEHKDGSKKRRFTQPINNQLQFNQGKLKPLHRIQSSQDIQLSRLPMGDPSTLQLTKIASLHEKLLLQERVEESPQEDDRNTPRNDGAQGAAGNQAMKFDFRVEEMNQSQRKLQLIFSYAQSKKCQCPEILIVDDDSFSTIALQRQILLLGFNADVAFSED